MGRAAEVSQVLGLCDIRMEFLVPSFGLVQSGYCGHLENEPVDRSLSLPFPLSITCLSKLAINKSHKKCFSVLICYFFLSFYIWKGRDIEINLLSLISLSKCHNSKSSLPDRSQDSGIHSVSPKEGPGSNYWAITNYLPACTDRKLELGMEPGCELGHSDMKHGLPK